MKKSQLRQIIQEEIKSLKEQRGDRNDAFDMLEKLRDDGIEDTAILDYIIGNHLSGDMAYEVISDYIQDELQA